MSTLFQAIVSPSGIRIRNIVEQRHPQKHEFYRQEAIKMGLAEPKFDFDDPSNGKIVNTIFDDFKIS